MDESNRRLPASGMADCIAPRAANRQGRTTRVSGDPMMNNRRAIDRVTARHTMMAMSKAIRCTTVALLVLAGCQRPIPPTEPTQARLVLADEAESDRAWEACQAVLRDYRFRLDRVDRRAGIITTLPETSQSFFEFWRHDVDTPFDFAEATLRTVRRTAVVEWVADESGNNAFGNNAFGDNAFGDKAFGDNAPADHAIDLATMGNNGDQTPVMRVAVLRETFATPERQFNSTAASLRVFGTSLPGVRGEPFLLDSNDYWIADGRDGAMEARLLQEMLRRTGAAGSN